MKYKFKTRPYRHQVDEIKKLLRRGWGGGLLWEPGTGKTKTIVDWASILHMKGELSRLMVVCPLSVVGVWADEIALHSPLYDKGDISIVEYDKKMDEIEEYKDGLTICVINYDIIWRRDEVVEAFMPQGVVCDESHRIKKPSARRSMYMRRLNKTPFRAILTGTPTPKSFYDLYGQWVFLNRNRFGTRADDFKERYLVYAQRYNRRGGYKELRGYKNVQDLRKKVKKDATTLRKDQCLDLPPEVYQRIPVHLEPHVMKAYNTLATEYFLELSDGDIIDAKNVLSKISKLQQLTGGWVFAEQGLKALSTAKINALEDLLVDRFEFNKKVVVFARFRAEVEAIRKLGVERFRIPTYVIRGGQKREERDTARRLFQSLPGPSLFVAQIQSGGLGITLHSSHEAIFYSVTHALDDYVQARGRIHRSGQTHKVTYRQLVAINTIDVEIYQALRNKEEITRVIMGNPSKLKGGQL